ncbi:unnamed protein product, partial [Vitis vinifera]
MDSNSNQVVAQDPSPAQTSNQAANGDGSHTVITGMDAKVYKAAARGNIKVLEKISDHDLLVHLTPKHNTILHIAAQFGQLECVNLILSLPSSPTLLQRPNLKGDIPLHLAAREGHFEVLKALLDAAKKLPTDIETGLEADKLMLRMTNKEKDTALHEAVRCVQYFSQYSLVKLLIEKDPEYTYGANVSGGTPLYMAAERGFTGIVKIILNKSHKTPTSPAYSGFMGRTALHAAVLCNDEEMTEAILEWNPALTKEVDEKGWSPLHCAAERNCNPTIVRQLLENSDYKSVAYLGIKDDFRFLFDRKVDKKAYNSENLTAYDIISRAKEDISKKKILEQFEHVMPETRSLRWKKMRERQRKRREFITAYDIILRHEENSTEERYNEKRIVALREQGKNHLIVSTLITTVTFAAGFTLPGGYKDDNGKAILSKKALFITFRCDGYHSHGLLTMRCISSLFYDHA